MIMEAKIVYGDCSLVTASGANNSVYLIPAEEADGVPQVFVWGNVGSGVPERSWHHRWMYVCGVSATAVEASVQDVLRAHEDELLALASEYQGAEWNGSNRVGSWGGEDRRATIDRLRAKISEAMSGVQTYWEASDWYGSVSIGDVVCSDLSLDDLVEHEVANAASDATLDSDDVRKWIVGAAEEWLKQHEDSEDDSDAKLRARLRCLLDADLE